MRYTKARSFFTVSTAALLVFNILFGSIPYISEPTLVNAQLTAEREAQLRAELAEIERQQAETQKILSDTQKQASSLQRDITLLNARNKAAQLEIQKKNILIQTLGKDITNKNKKIATLEERITRGKESLAQIMRKANEIDSLTLPELVLSSGDLSDTVADLDQYDSIQASLKDLFEDLRSDQKEATEEKRLLSVQKDKATDAKEAIEDEKRQIEQNEKTKQSLLKVTKNQEASYQKVLAERAKRAAEIRAALFALRDSAAIPFGKALEYALIAEKQTGIRPAFLLAILTQESALGKNVGSCYLTNPQTGEGVGARTGNTIKNVMKPGRDTEPFMKITEELGIDPYKTLVSCPQSIGWGGAMGPAQFIPSTWQLFKTRIAKMLGVKIADPWRPADAFMASAIYLTDLGAVNGSYTGERNAACRYYSGSSCKAGSINSTYGDQVMAKARTIQTTMIDPLQGV